MNLFIYFLFLLGLCIGSFLNVVIYRLAEEKSLLGRSFCPHCKHQIAWYDNVPLLSFIILRGRCRHCNKKISWQYPLVELSMGLWAVFSARGGSAFGGSFHFLIGQGALTCTTTWLQLVTTFVIGAIFIVIFVYDLKYSLIPDQVLIPGIIFFWWIFLFQEPPFEQFLSTLYGIAVYVVILGFLAIVTKGRGMGWGDVKLGILLGLFLRFPLSIYGLLLAFWGGAIISIILLLIGKKKMKDTIPFGPFLIGSTVLVWFFQDWVIKVFQNFWWL